jgi:hypothetical protein
MSDEFENRKPHVPILIESEKSLVIIGQFKCSIEARGALRWWFRS